ncbi:MAG: hypothetical protein ABW023_16440 [Sphingomonas sp.]
MEQTYFGPTQKAVTYLNRALALPATGAEQDWELELADPNKLTLMVELLDSNTLDEETRSALVVLILHSMQQAYDDGADVSATVRSVRTEIRTDAALRTQMISYWARYDPVLAVLT